VVVYCHHGIRSLRGAAILEQAGVRPASDTAGGIDAWSRLIDPSVPRY
jgi:rhodanese-related sulfurtransferase